MRHKITFLVILSSLLAVTVSANAEDLATHVRAIEQAEDPSAAIAAFHEAFTEKGQNVKLYRAYVHRMVDFGLADLAYEQAETLTEMDDDDGRAWAVVALGHIEEGQVTDALLALEQAVDEDKSDPFVQYTAGQILAFYDSQPPYRLVSVRAERAADEIRDELEQEELFREGYLSDVQNLREGQSSSFQTDTKTQNIVILPEDFDDDDDETTIVYHSYTTNPYVYDSPRIVLRFGYGSRYGYFHYGPSHRYYGFKRRKPHRDHDLFRRYRRFHRREDRHQRDFPRYRKREDRDDRKGHKRIGPRKEESRTKNFQRHERARSRTRNRLLREQPPERTRPRAERNRQERKTRRERIEDRPSRRNERRRSQRNR